MQNYAKSSRIPYQILLSNWLFATMIFNFSIKEDVISRIYLSHFSSFALLRYARANKAKITRLKSLPSGSPNLKKSELVVIQKNVCKLAMQNFKLDVMLRSSNKKIKNDLVNFHYYKTQLPGKYFLKITVDDEYLQNILFDKIYICSPELTYFQLSKNFPQIRLMLLAMELCSNYALDFTTPAGFINKIPQATNIKELKIAAAKFDGLYFGKSEVAKDSLR